MSDGNRQRPAIDLDDLERQLRAVAQPKAARPLPPESAPFAVKPVFAQSLPENESFAAREPEATAPQPEPRTPSRAPDYDPLAELARIAQSGSDWSVPQKPSEATSVSPAAAGSSAVDALEALLRMDPPVKAPPPSFPPIPPRRPLVKMAPEAEPSEQPMLDFPAPAEPVHAAPSEGSFYAYAQAQTEAEPVFAPEGALPPHDGHFLDEEPQPRRRTGLRLAVALAGVAALGVGGVMIWRGGEGLPGSGAPRTPPVIKASNEPAKVAPQNPGGMEVPNANQEIFAGSKNTAGPVTPGKVVTSEEQPVDVNQAARPGQPRVILPNGGSAATVAPAPPPPVSTVPRDPKQAAAPAVPQTAAPATGNAPALGEPKKVRTVLVRPDGTVIDGTEPAKPPAMAVPPSVTPASPVPTQTLPAAAAAPPASGSPLPAIVPASPAPTQTGSTAATDLPPQPAPAGTPLPPRRPVIAAAPAAAPEPQLAPAKPAAPIAAPAPAAPAVSLGAGDFAVQLAAPPTEQEARSLASRLAQRYGEALAGQEPEIIRAEVNGKTLFRVRVTGLDRESANTMCNRIKSAQGSCFVAKN